MKYASVQGVCMGFNLILFLLILMNPNFIDDEGQAGMASEIYSVRQIPMIAAKSHSHPTVNLILTMSLERFLVTVLTTQNVER